MSLLPTPTDKFIGIMSGTSMDGADAVVIDESDFKRILAHVYLPYPEDLHSKLNQLVSTPKITLWELGNLEVELAHFYADVVNELLTTTGIPRGRVRAIGCHGQTIFHAPSEPFPFTMQIGSGATLAQLTECDVINDFRSQDIAAGGQGAPLASLFHEFLFQEETPVMALNLGGIANLTYIPETESQKQVIGFDTGPANALMNEWVMEIKGERYDDKGAWAASGRVNSKLLERLKNDPYFQKLPPKSTGREYFNQSWLRATLGESLEQLPAEDVQRTLAQLTVETVLDSAGSFQHSKLIVCGGGVHNQFLMEQFEQQAQCQVLSCQAYNIEPESIEAAAFAYMAYCCLEGKRGNVPSVTGASRPVITGAIHRYLN